MPFSPLCLRTIQKFCLIAALLFVATNSHAETNSWGVKDVEGGHDHPLITRFEGSWLIGYQTIDYDQTTFPTKTTLVGMNELDAPETLEGRITRIMYMAPAGKRPLEVQKNYLMALEAAGFKQSLGCSGEACEHVSYGYYGRMNEMKIMNFGHAVQENPSLKAILRDVDSGSNLFGQADKYLFVNVGTLSANGVTAHILISSDKHYSGDLTTTYIEIVEPKPMKTGQSNVNLDALKTSDAITTSMTTQGKVAIYGVYFDTGKAEIKPESKAQLDEMAKYLTANPDKKVFIVGHTDNQGSFNLNVKLSMDRAKAVASTLSSNYKINAARLIAQGIANLSPVNSNGDEPGRAKNRRVELVEQ